MSELERQLASIVRRHRARKESLESLESERDEIIRRAIGAKVPRKKLVEITGLSPQRIHQIGHRSHT